MPFYIGVGTIKKDSLNRASFLYKRAYSRDSRNRYWNFIVNNTSYDVEILYESDSKEDVLVKEKYFISLYGRRDNNTGVLCNLTDGGEGSTNLSEDVIKIIVEKNRANGCFDRHGKRLAERNRLMGSEWKGKTRPDDYFKNKKQFVYNINGVFIGEYASIQKARRSLGIKNFNQIRSAKLSNSHCNGYFFSDTFLGHNIDKMPLRKYSKCVYMIDYHTLTLIDKYLSMRDAAKDNNYSESQINNYAYNKLVKDSRIFSFSESVNKSDYRVLRSVSKRGVRTNICANCKGIKTQSYESTYCLKCCAERTKKYKIKKGESRTGF